VWRWLFAILLVLSTETATWPWAYWEGPEGGPSWPSRPAVDAAGDIVFTETAGASWTGSFRVTKLAGASGAVLWGPIRIGDVGMCGGGSAAATDPAGDVFVAGFLSDDCTEEGREFTVAKLAGGDGSILWIRRLMGAWGAAYGIAVAPDGDVIALGFPLVVKLSAASGDEQWRVENDGGARGFNSVAVNAAGRIAVGGFVYTDRVGGLVMVLDVATGAERWEYRLMPDTNQYLLEFIIQIAGDGTVLAVDGAGGRDEATTTVVRLAADGAEEWRHELSSFRIRAIPPQLDAEGSVYVGGRSAQSGNPFSASQMVVVKVAPTGTDAWQARLGVTFYWGEAQAIVVGDGMVVAGGHAPNEWYEPDLRLVTFDTASGEIRWQRTLDAGDVAGVGRDPAGNVVVTARRPLPGRFDSSATVLKFDGATGQGFGCGNGTLDAGEQCDDSNTDEGDGCDSNCQLSSTTTTSLTSSTTRTTSSTTSTTTTTTSSTSTSTLPLCDTISCDDGDPCTTDACLSPGGCVHQQVPGDPRLCHLRSLVDVRRALIASALADTAPSDRGRRRALGRLTPRLHQVQVAIDRVAARAQMGGRAGHRLEIALWAYNERVLASIRQLGGHLARQLLLPVS
jgi:cysteine-rich repeat protein